MRSRDDTAARAMAEALDPMKAGVVAPYRDKSARDDAIEAALLILDPRA